MVLVVDDEPMVREVVARVPRARRHARARGWATATRPSSGWASQRADLVVLDVMLPGVDGLSLSCGASGAAGDTPVILLTARTEEIDRVVGLELGADDYVIKPFSPRSWRCGCATCCAATPPARRSRHPAPVSGCTSATATPDPRHRHRGTGSRPSTARRACSRRRSSTCSPCSPVHRGRCSPRRQLLDAGVGLGAGIPGPGDRDGAHRPAAPEVEPTPSIRAGSSRRGASATGSSREPRRLGRDQRSPAGDGGRRGACSPPAPSAPGWHCAP